MNTVICSLSAKYIHSALAPWCLAAGARAFCHGEHRVQVLESTINRPLADTLEELLALEPQLAAFPCYIWNIPQVLELVKRVKERRPGTLILLGGPEVSYRAGALLRECPQVDYLLAGEGELPFARLLDALEGVGGLEEVPGLARRVEGQVEEKPPYVGTEDPPSPYCPDYLAALKGRIAYLETSRGCPFSCAFCLSGRGDTVRFFDLERAKRELLLLGNSGTKTVKLVDRTFNCNPGRAYELLSFLLEKRRAGELPQGVCFHFEVGADLFDDRTLELLEGAPRGFFQMEAGLQSFHPGTLAAVARKTDMARLEGNLARLIAMGNMHIHVDLIAGLPREDLGTFGESFDRAYALRPGMLQLGFLKLLYGSALRQTAGEWGCAFDPEPPYEFTSTPSLGPGEKEIIHQAEDALERVYNSGKFRLTLEYLLAATGWRPFELFCRFGGYAQGRGTTRLALEEYTGYVWDFFRGQPGVEEERLRDLLVCDRLAGENTGRIPPCLYRPDPDTRLLRRRVEEKGGFPGRFGLALLYHRDSPRGVAADYSQKDPITGRHPLYSLTPEGEKLGIPCEKPQTVVY